LTTPDREVRATSWEVGAVVGSYGLGFGALAVASGFSLAQTIVLSAVVFTGASQFALVSVVGSGGVPLAGVAAGLALGSRNAFYALRLRALLQPRGWRRAVAAQLTIDESTAVALAQPDVRLSRIGFWTTGLAVYVAWNIATVIGGLAVEQISDPEVIGLDAAVGAAFLALIWPQLTTVQLRVVAAGGALIALALTPVLPQGLPVLAAAAVAMAAAWPEPRGATPGATPGAASGATS
jgi:predicted branched-subunit amino acid permease